MRASNEFDKDMEKAAQIFRFLMEEGYYPTYEKTHIIFRLDDNQATLEYQNGIITIRIFFSIEEETLDMFLEAANATMSESICVKPVILEDRKTLMLCTETMCDNIREFKKFFPRSVGYIKDALYIHRHQMRKLLQKNVLYKDLYTHDHEYDTTKKFCN